MNTFAKIQAYLPADMILDLKMEYQEWCSLLDKDIIFNHTDSEIHTKLHTARVLLFALLLVSDIIPDNDNAKRIMAHASLFHDTRRIDDGFDIGHGVRAASYYRDYSMRSGLHFFQEAELIMKYHDIADMRGKVGLRKEYKGSLPTIFKLYDIFKDADALDRYRLGDGGLDPKYLRTLSSKAMMPFARDLVAATS